MEQMLEEKLKRETLQPKQSAQAVSAPYLERRTRLVSQLLSHLPPSLCAISCLVFVSAHTTTTQRVASGPPGTWMCNALPHLNDLCSSM